MSVSPTLLTFSEPTIRLNSLATRPSFSRSPRRVEVEGFVSSNGGEGADPVASPTRPRRGSDATSAADKLCVATARASQHPRGIGMIFPGLHRSEEHTSELQSP